MRLILAALIIVGTIWPGESMGWNESDVLEKSGKGVINWSQGTIYATYKPSKIKGSNQKSHPLLTQKLTFRTDLLKDVLSTAQSLRIDHTLHVRDLSAETEAYFAKIRDLVADAQIVLRTDPQDHVTKATARIPIYGGFSQLVLPKDIKQVQTIKLIVPVSNETNITRKSTRRSKVGVVKPYTGLIVDARNINALPALVPIIYDELNQEVYGPAFVSREFAVQYGLAGYTHSFEAALRHIRVTDNPLVVKGLRLHPSGPCNIIISNLDATRVRNTYDHLSFLRECHVMIVLD